MLDGLDLPQLLGSGDTAAPSSLAAAATFATDIGDPIRRVHRGISNYAGSSPALTTVPLFRRYVFEVLAPGKPSWPLSRGSIRGSRWAERPSRPFSYLLTGGTSARSGVAWVSLIHRAATGTACATTARRRPRCDGRSQTGSQRAVSTKLTESPVIVRAVIRPLVHKIVKGRRRSHPVSSRLTRWTGCDVHARLPRKSET